MKIIFDDWKGEKLLKEEVEKIKNLIPKLELPFKENLSNYFQFLSEQEKKEIYLEIHWPFFEYGITLFLSIIKGKFLISVLDHKDSIIYGNLLVEGFSCIDNKELKKLGEWQNYSNKKLKILKLFQGTFHK